MTTRSRRSCRDTGRAAHRRRGTVLLQVGGDRGEDAGQIAADRTHHDDGGDGDQGGDQTILDGGGAAIVPQQTRKTVEQIHGSLLGELTALENPTAVKGALNGAP